MVGRKNIRIAQITIEYSILITLIVVFLLAMKIYVKRGLSARLKDSIDYPLTISEANFSTGQYEPDYYFSSSSSEQNFIQKDSIEKGAVETSSNLISSASTTERINR